MRLDRNLALQRGGWDPRFARLLAFTANQMVAAALVDTNGDLSAIDIDYYTRMPDGHWESGASGSAGETGAGATSDAVAAWGRADVGTAVTVLYHGKVETVVVDEPSGWWLYVVPIEPAAAAGEIPVRI